MKIFMDLKLRRLPEIDLANTLLMDKVSKRRQLLRFARGSGFWSYDPARSAVSTVFNASNPLGLELEKVSDETILKIVERSCKKKVQRDSCLEVTKLLIEFRNRHVERAVERRIPSLAIGDRGRVQFASSVLYMSDGVPCVPFFDHRRNNGLTANGRYSAFSMMHQSVRVPDPDLEAIDLSIIQFKQRPKEVRSYQVHKASDLGKELLSFDQILELIEETYSIWVEVQEEVFAGKRRAEPSKGDDRQHRFYGI